MVAHVIYLSLEYQNYYSMRLGNALSIFLLDIKHHLLKIIQLERFTKSMKQLELNEYL